MMNNHEILNYAIENDYGFDLVKDNFEDMDNLTIINSVSTDIEILNAMNSILSLMLTSGQFISIHQFFDRKITNQKKIEGKKEETRELAKVILEEIVNVVSAYKNKVEVSAFEEMKKVMGDHSPLQ